MLGKDDILELILNECDIVLHLYGKVPPGGMDYRPTPGQRSTLELLRYLSYCAIAGAKAMADGDWEAYRAYAEAGAALPADDFPAALERQKSELRTFFEGLTQEQLETQTASTPVGQEMSLEKALVLLPLHWMVGYRMQLYLYCRQGGNDQIWTPNCWLGLDMERPTPQEAPAE